MFINFPTSNSYFGGGIQPSQVSTIALGEEGWGSIPPQATTMALGEEGGGQPPQATTLALGEEGGGGFFPPPMPPMPPISSMALAEEGGGGNQVSFNTFDYLTTAAEGDHYGDKDGAVTKEELSNRLASYTYTKEKIAEVKNNLSGMFGLSNPGFAFIFQMIEAQLTARIQVAERLQINFDQIDGAEGTADGKVTKREILTKAFQDGNPYTLSDQDLGIVTIQEPPATGA